MTAADLHANGIHTQCKTKRTKTGDGSHRDCPRAGKVERYHGHDFDGPLWAACGCEEFAD
ncbi:hypothetical protein AB0H43_03065 [Hamadaea sp. NPDC050747]|uniref:hypothetical protein n=1 Tax=Hamadaea sp. NPDC050747 TaxID=3155789 RepID=UPI0033E12D63